MHVAHGRAEARTLGPALPALEAGDLGLKTDDRLASLDDRLLGRRNFGPDLPRELEALPAQMQNVLPARVRVVVGRRDLHGRQAIIAEVLDHHGGRVARARHVAFELARRGDPALDALR